MARRSAEYLVQANYREWQVAVAGIKNRKKAGYKLDILEKATLKTVPTPENPFKGVENAIPVLRKTRATKTVDTVTSAKDVTRKATFKTYGGVVESFLCPVKGTACQDATCALTCEEKECGFYGKGYFRIKGLQKQIAQTEVNKKAAVVRKAKKKTIAAKKFVAKKRSEKGVK